MQLLQNEQALDDYIKGDDYEVPLDGIWLLQQYIQPQHNFITRCEFVGGKYIYAVNVNTEQGFELCPADVCAVEDNFCPATAAESASAAQSKFSITTEFDHHPIIGQLEQCLADNGIEVAGIEIIRDRAGELYAYDINTNTNYNSQAESAANVAVSGMDAVAAFLAGLAK